MTLTTARTLVTATAFSLLSLGSLNAHAGKADNVDYFAADKYGKSSYKAKGSYTSGDSRASSQTIPANRVVAKVPTGEGEVFATAQGMTLYTFTKDSSGRSNCYDGCAASWPPFHAQPNARTWGAFSVIQRDDGTYQWAYKDQPLYTWIGDTKQGDTNGQGMGNVWFVAQPE